MSRPAVSAIALEYRIDLHELLEDYEERAAIREKEGGLSKEDAERGAVEDCRVLAAQRAAGANNQAGASSKPETRRKTIQ